jgi:hypothetical protein
MEALLMVLIGLLIMSLLAIIDLYYLCEKRAKREIKELKDKIRMEQADRLAAKAYLDKEFNLVFRKGRRIV